MVGKTALTQAVHLIYFSSVAFKLCSRGSTKKNTEKSIMVLGGKYPTGNSLINSQKPIFPRSIARLSHSKVHETEKVLDAAIEAVEVQMIKTR